MVVHDKFYVKSIVRDDGVRFDFDHKEIYLATDNTLLIRPEVQTSEVQYTEMNGGEMIGQRTTSPEQDLSGVILPKTTPYWDLYFKLSSFFVINRLYTIVYSRAGGGGLMAQRNAWLSRNLQVAPRPYEDGSSFTVGFKLQSGVLTEYAENNAGEEQWANTVTLPLAAMATGGEQWDAIGEVWDSVGTVWENGEGGLQNTFLASTSVIYPVWEVRGEAVNPSLQNNSTDTLAQYNGTVSAGQTLVVDFANGTARLDGALVTRNVFGEVYMRPGMNILGFATDGGDVEHSYLHWNNNLGGA